MAGELWGVPGRAVRELAQDPRLRGRVTVQPGYVPADRLAELLASHDVLALTYRRATASQNALLGQRTACRSWPRTSAPSAARSATGWTVWWCRPATRRRSWPPCGG